MVVTLPPSLSYKMHFLDQYLYSFIISAIKKCPNLLEILLEVRMHHTYRINVLEPLIYMLLLHSEANEIIIWHLSRIVTRSGSLTSVTLNVTQSISTSILIVMST